MSEKSLNSIIIDINSSLSEIVSNTELSSEYSDISLDEIKKLVSINIKTNQILKSLIGVNGLINEPIIRTQPESSIPETSTKSKNIPENKTSTQDNSSISTIYSNIGDILKNTKDWIVDSLDTLPIFIIKKTKGFLGSVFGKVKGMLGSVVKGMQSVLSSITGAFMEGFNTAVGDTFKNLKDQFKGTFKFLKLDGLNKWMKAKKEGLKKGMQDKLFTPLKNMFKSIGDSVKSFSIRLLGVITTGFTYIGLAIGFIIGAILSPLGLIVLSLIGLGALIYNFWDEIKQMWSSMVDYVKEAWTNFTNVLSEMWDSMSKSVTGAWNKLSTGMSKMWSSMTDFITKSNIFAPIRDLFNVVKEKFNEILKYFSGTSLVDIVKDVFNFYKEMFSKVLEYFSSTSLVDIVKDVFNFYKEMFSKVLNYFENIGLLDVVKNVFNSFKDKFDSIVKYFSENSLLDVVKDVFTKIKDVFTKIWDSAITLIRKIPMMGGFGTTSTEQKELDKKSNEEVKPGPINNPDYKKTGDDNNSLYDNASKSVKSLSNSVMSFFSKSAEETEKEKQKQTHDILVNIKKQDISKLEPKEKEKMDNQNINNTQINNTNTTVQQPGNHGSDYSTTKRIKSSEGV